MSTYRISELTVKRLWGWRDVTLTFFDDVNLIIGPNASGKTTIINLLHHVLTGNFPMLMAYDFQEITIKIAAFDGHSTRKLHMAVHDEHLRVKVSKKSFDLSLALLHERYRGEALTRYPRILQSRRLREDLEEVRAELDGLVNTAWLPVSRRLPISQDEELEVRPRRGHALESVDECLDKLLDKLQQYRVALDSQLAELRKDFQRHALEKILYDKRLDSESFPRTLLLPTKEDRRQLLKAFEDVGFKGKDMRERIEEHFTEATKAIRKLKETPTQLDLKTVFIIPLIGRTNAMVEFAQELETNRRKLFAPLALYVDTANSFFQDKKVEISEKGELSITAENRKAQNLDWRQLSSGEKQILILLTQALLSAEQPVVYVADEPELSLHVTWQEKLVKSLLALAGQCQLILATHSPDVVSDFEDRIIDLARI